MRPRECGDQLYDERRAMRAKLYGVPGSQNTAIAEAMLRHKGIPYTRRDLIPGAHRLLLVRLLGFPGTTVPALKLRKRVLGTRPIARALDEQQPEPPLFPADPEERQRVEDAERFGEEVMQQLSRHVLWVAFKRHPAAVKSFLADARLGFPAQLSEPATGAVISLMCLDDLRPIVERHLCAKLALARYPSQPGRVPSVLSEEERALLSPLRTSNTIDELSLRRQGISVHAGGGMRKAIVTSRRATRVSLLPRHPV